MGQMHHNKIVSAHVNKKRSSIQLEEQNWVVLQKPEINIQQMGNFDIYRNKVTGQIARGYQLNMYNNNSLKAYIQQFDYWRAQMHQNVIESKYIIYDEEIFGFSQLCSNNHPVKIFVQNPSITLADIRDIPIPEGLKIILSALVGFQNLFDLFGYFTVLESMITINQNGVVKVWMHPNLSQNRPLPIVLNKISAEDMQSPDCFIKELIELIDKNIDYLDDNTFSNYLGRKYENRGRLSFNQCRKYLLNFAQQIQIDLPDSLSQILDILFSKTSRNSISQQDIGSRDVLYGKNYMNAYILGQDQQNQADQQFNPISNLQSPSQNSQFQSHPQNNQHSYLFPQDNQKPRNSVQQLSSMSHHSHTNNLPRNYSYNNSNTIQDDPNIIIQYPSHRQSYPAHNVFSQEKSFLPLDNKVHLLENPYHSLVQRQTYEKRSVIQEQIEQESFLTSYRNSKFQSSRDLRRGSNYIKKHHKNIPAHRHTLSSRSDSRINIQNIESASPRQVKIRQQSSKLLDPNFSQPSITKKSQTSIQFHTLYEVKQLDAQIAEDLQKMFATFKK